MTAALSLLAFLIAFLLEEAAVWFARSAVGTLREDPDDEHAVDLAQRSRGARTLSHVFFAIGALFLAAAARTVDAVWAAPAAFAAALTVSGLAAAWLAPHGRSPLNPLGRALFRPLHRVGTALRAVVRVFRRGLGLRSPHNLVERVLEMDQVLEWLSGERLEDETERVVATLHEFGEATAADLMVPREEVVGIPAGATVAQAIVLTAEEGYSRYPVYRDSLDNVEGVLHVFDLLEADDDAPVGSLARPPLVTTGTKPASRLLRELQLSYNQLAVIVDEFGGTAGIVTVEDLLEELVGEIHDETDEEEALVRALARGVFWVDAAIPVDDLNETLELDLEEGEYDTLAGLVLERLERIPRTGERIRENGVLLEVIAAEAHRVRAFKLTLLETDNA